MYDEILTLDDIQEEVGGKYVSLRTLDNIVRAMGFRKGCSRKKLFSRDQANAIKGQLICQSSTNPAHEKTIGSSLSEAPLKAGNTKSQQTQRTREMLRIVGLNSANR